MSYIRTRSGAQAAFAEWRCPECGLTESWSYRDLVESGGPVCPECDVDMVPNWENE